AGCYLADHLLRLVPDSRIDVIERLPVPFGLVRHGVAPDHQGTKAVARVFDRVLSRDRVGFFGHVEVGRDVTLGELEALYDAVVIATGAPDDRRLGIPGEDLPGVVGSGRFVGWLNGHPDHPAPELRPPRSAVIIGNGNVALDVARLLAKTPAELVGSDLGAAASDFLASAPLDRIHVVGRRGPEAAKFTDHELSELATLERARPVVADPARLRSETSTQEIMRGFAALPPKPVTIAFHFGLVPDAMLGQTAVEAVRFRDADGKARELAADLVVTCVGYQAHACCSQAPTDGRFASDGGHIRDRLFAVGWAKRGPSGTIPTNRIEAQAVAQRIADKIGDGDRSGGAGLRAMLDRRGVATVDQEGWRRIEGYERERADANRCRRKLTTVDEMLTAAGR
ncbi:MAG TPA: FAD-dependent oxidoreductase, partial [Aliidongia sp.]|uniref:FAD-dependent oxidoreductase n=1 Tax=Aliidongia sp. TaxID=1914230 RepID=UPI002DDCD723